MAFLQRSETMEEAVLPALCLKTVYNFTYRLSGNPGIARDLTEKTFLSHSRGDDYADYNVVFLLRQAWESFLEYKGCIGSVDFKGKEPVQEALLALTPESRCAVILRHVLGYSYGEIEQILNKPEEETIRLISVGIHKIRKKIKIKNMGC